MRSVPLRGSVCVDVAIHNREFSSATSTHTSPPHWFSTVRRRSEPLFLRHQLWILWIAFIRRGHYLHTVLVEEIQHVAVQPGIDNAHSLRIVAIDIDLIGDSK